MSFFAESRWLVAIVVTLAAPGLRAEDADRTADHDPQRVARLVATALQQGNAGRGAVLYAAPTSACLSCHKVGPHGGQVGPDLSTIGAKQKLDTIVESLLWPRKVVADEYRSIAVVRVDGRIVRGYRIRETDDVLEIGDTGSGATVVISQDEIDSVEELGSLMPEGLLATMSQQDQLDLIAFLADLGRHQQISAEAIESLLSHARAHHPVAFDVPRAPLDREIWPSWQAEVNRDRVYDFYAKQARHFRELQPRPSLLAEFPGLDGGSYGHWGNQSEPDWADARWNETDLGSLLCGVFHGDGITVARGVCVRLGSGDDRLSACFDPDTLSYPRVWSGGFVTFTAVRHGFMQGLTQDGPTIAVPAVELPYDPRAARKYHGFYRHGDRVIFAYRVGETEYLDAPTLADGKFQRVVAAREQHPDRDLLSGGPPQWPQQLTTRGQLGPRRPYTVDKIELPTDNPWQALLYVGDHDFLSDGSAILCTMQGDVWRASGLDDRLDRVTWRRIASGLHQPLGLIVHDDQIHVIGRDQLTRLHDTNGDGESDFYECFSQALETSTSGHDFTCGLWRDPQGRFYTVSGKQGLMRIAADGQSAELLATGLRNSDGLGLWPDGTVTMPSSEGDWVPASMIAVVRPDSAVLNRLPVSPTGTGLPFLGRPGTDRRQPPELPMLYLPRGLDNSSGGQVYVSSDRWGPLQDQLVHLSFGAGTAFLLLRDEQDGWVQGAAVPLTGEFASGVHRGRFHPLDGQLYVSGMAGWGTYTTDDGCFERVRFTGQPVQLPVGFHVHANGIRLSFSEPLERSEVEQPQHHFAQTWNYRYSGAYGSPEYSTRQLGLRGHDVLEIKSVSVLADGRSLFLEIPDLQPVNQLHLLVKSSAQAEHDLFLTVHHLDAPLQVRPGTPARNKVILPHPLLADLKRPMVTRRNPHTKAIENAHSISIAAATNLMFDTTELHVRAGQPLRLTFSNPDVVPHNWALLQPGALQEVGEQANKLISDPDAAANHYIPESDKVLVYTDVVEPYASFTIYFQAPAQPGRYPYLCTFPGHWMVMNGTMVVQ